MSFCAEPATAGIATVRTLRINAKLAAFNLISPYFLVLSISHCTLFAVLTIENNYYRNTKNEGNLQLT